MSLFSSFLPNLSRLPSLCRIACARLPCAARGERKTADKEKEREERKLALALMRLKSTGSRKPLI